ncbi:MAG: LPXTG cell wall anchor domain-containing protein, partial [Candidatus Thorarchaeota archaeon]
RDVDESISLHIDELNEISDHLFAIAESWKAAADALAEVIDFQDETQTQGSLMIAAGGAFVAIILAVVAWRRKKSKAP